MSSGYGDGPQYRSWRGGSDRDYYEPDRHSMRNFAGPDGYAVREDYKSLSPTEDLSTSPSALSRARSQRSMRDGAFGAPGSEKNGAGSHGERSGRSSSRRSHRDLQKYDDDYDSDSSFEEEKRRGSKGAVSKLKRRVSQVFDNNNVNEEGNTQVKKWGATLAGAVVGGLAGRQAKGSEHWVPTALGAVIGGLTAREAEKGYFKYKEERAQEREVWSGRKRSRSTGH